jgi:hypothetical protein
VLRLSGYSWVSSNVEASIINNFVRHGYRCSACKFNSEDLCRFADVLRDGIEFVMAQVTATNKGKSILRKNALLVALVRGYYSRKIKRERLVQFISILSSGIVDNKATDSSAILLRDFILEVGSDNKHPYRHQLYGRSERALSTFAQERGMKVLKPGTKELFPHPIDQEMREAVNEVRRLDTGLRRKKHQGHLDLNMVQAGDDDDDDDE